MMIAVIIAVILTMMTIFIIIIVVTFFFQTHSLFDKFQYFGGCLKEKSSLGAELFIQNFQLYSFACAKMFVV